MLDRRTYILDDLRKFVNSFWFHGLLAFLIMLLILFWPVAGSALTTPSISSKNDLKTLAESISRHILLDDYDGSIYVEPCSNLRIEQFPTGYVWINCGDEFNDKILKIINPERWAEKMKWKLYP